MSEQSAWDDLSWPASTMTFATFYQDVKLVQKQLEEATRTRTGKRNLRFGVVPLSLLLYKLRASRSKLDRVNGPCFCPGPTAPGALPLA